MKTDEAILKELKTLNQDRGQARRRAGAEAEVGR